MTLFNNQYSTEPFRTNIRLVFVASRKVEMKYLTASEILPRPGLSPLKTEQPNTASDRLAQAKRLQNKSPLLTSFSLFLGCLVTGCGRLSIYLSNVVLDNSVKYDTQQICMNPNGDLDL